MEKVKMCNFQCSSCEALRIDILGKGGKKVIINEDIDSTK